MQRTGNKRRDQIRNTQKVLLGREHCRARMSEEIQIVISGDRLRFIHQDDLAETMQVGNVTTFRASHVEPGEDGWNADLRPVNGPVLGRDTALQAEAKWLRQHLTPIPKE